MQEYLECPSWEEECPYFHDGECLLETAELDCDMFEFMEHGVFEYWD